jgi:hypothetical protein
MAETFRENSYAVEFELFVRIQQVGQHLELLLNLNTYSWAINILMGSIFLVTKLYKICFIILMDI